MSRLAPSRSFSRVGLGSIIPRGSISLLVTFRTLKNYRTESIVFDVMQVNLLFITILGQPALYQFMAIAHYGSSRSVETAPPMFPHWRSSMHWWWHMRILSAMADRTRHPQARASPAQH
jgi:hypothetical protein